MSSASAEYSDIEHDEAPPPSLEDLNRFTSSLCVSQFPPYARFVERPLGGNKTMPPLFAVSRVAEAEAAALFLHLSGTHGASSSSSPSLMSAPPLEDDAHRESELYRDGHLENNKQQIVTEDKLM